VSLREFVSRPTNDTQASALVIDGQHIEPLHGRGQPDVDAREIVEDLTAALAEFEAVAAALEAAAMARSDDE